MASTSSSRSARCAAALEEPRGDPSFPHGDHHKHDARPTAHRLWLFSDRLLVGKPERFLFNERDFFGIAIDAPLAALRVAWSRTASGSFPHGKGDVAEPDVFTLEAPPPPGHHGKGAVWFAVHCESPKAAASLYAAIEAAIVADAEATKAHEHAVASRGATLPPAGSSCSEASQAEARASESSGLASGSLTSPSEDAHSLGRSLEERRDSRILRARQARQRTRETRQAKHKRGRPTAEKVDYEAQARAAALAEAEAEAAADAYAMAAAPSTRVSTTVRQDVGGTAAAASAAARRRWSRAKRPVSGRSSSCGGASSLCKTRGGRASLSLPRVGGASEQPDDPPTPRAAGGDPRRGRNSPSRRHSPEAVRQSEARRYRNIATGRHSPDGKLRRSVRPEHGDRGSGGRMSADCLCANGAAAGPSALAMSAISVGPERETTRVSRRAPVGRRRRRSSEPLTAGGARGSVARRPAAAEHGEPVAGERGDRHSLDGFI